jgi:hypothetical protein
MTVFAIAFAAVLYAWSSPGRHAMLVGPANAGPDEPGGTASGAGSANAPVALLRCNQDGVTTTTPVVQLQPDGLHLLIDSAVSRPAINISSGGRSVTIVPAADAQYPFGDVVSFPPGDAAIACGPSEEQLTRPVSVRLVDTLAVYHDDTLACDYARVVETANLPSFDSRKQSVAAGLRSVVPGLLSSDDISYAEYRLGEWGGSRYRIIRDGMVVATVDVASLDDTTVVGPLYACPGTGIGQQA